MAREQNRKKSKYRDLLHRFGFRQSARRLQGIKATNTRYLALHWCLRFLRNKIGHSKILQNPTIRVKMAPFLEPNRCRRSLYLDRAYGRRRKCHALQGVLSPKRLTGKAVLSGLRRQEREALDTLKATRCLNHSTTTSTFSSLFTAPANAEIVGSLRKHKLQTSPLPPPWSCKFTQTIGSTCI